MAANRAGYASDQTTISNDPDGSHTIVFESNGWRFEDNFFGGESYGGREVITVGGLVEWRMLYYGWVSGTGLTTDAVYKFLRTALMRVPPEKPYRGPGSFVALREIREVLAFRERGEVACGHVLDLILHHTAEVDRRIAELQRLRADLDRLARRARRLNPADCPEPLVCQVLVPEGRT